MNDEYKISEKIFQIYEIGGNKAEAKAKAEEKVASGSWQ
jgi:hypothetical protein